MHLVPDSQIAIDALTSEDTRRRLGRRLEETAGRVEELVPDVVALAVTVPGGDLAIVLSAPPSALTVLDALQRLAAPVRAARTGRAAPRTPGARAVACTLALPVRLDGEEIGTVTVYGGSGRAFAGHAEELAALLGAQAHDARVDDDLGFGARSSARRAVDVLDRHDATSEVARSTLLRVLHAVLQATDA